MTPTELADVIEDIGLVRFCHETGIAFKETEAQIIRALRAAPAVPEGGISDTKRLDFLQTTVHWDERNPEVSTFDDDFLVQEKLREAKGDLRGAIDAAMREVAASGKESAK